jgi:hypothetical protein
LPGKFRHRRKMTLSETDTGQRLTGLVGFAEFDGHFGDLRSEGNLSAEFDIPTMVRRKNDKRKKIYASQGFGVYRLGGHDPPLLLHSCDGMGDSADADHATDFAVSRGGGRLSRGIKTAS